MRRSLASVLALGLISLVGLVRCTSSTPRNGFVDPGAGTPDGGNVVAGDDDDDTGPSFNLDAGKGIDADDRECTQDIDVVLVLDVSSSMGFVLDKLGADIAGIVDAANKLKAGARFGFVGYADNGAFGLGGSDENGRVHTKATTLKKAFTDMKATYTQKNRNPGDGPAGRETQNPLCEENALDALYMAAKDFPWRPNAARVVIIATDDTFLQGADNYGDRDNPPDGDTTGTGFPTEGDYPAVHTLGETIKALKDAKARVFSFTALKAPGFLDTGKCGTGRRHTEADCNAFGWSKPYDGEEPIPKQTDGKNFDLAGIKDDKISLKDTINEVVLQTHCAGDPPK